MGLEKFDDAIAEYLETKAYNRRIKIGSTF